MGDSIQHHTIIMKFAFAAALALVSQPTTTATATDTTATPTPAPHLTPATPAMTTPAMTADMATATTTAATATTATDPDTTEEDTTTERGTQAESVLTTVPTGPILTSPTEAHTVPPTASGECTPTFGVRVDSQSRILA